MWFVSLLGWILLAGCHPGTHDKAPAGTDDSTRPDTSAVDDSTDPDSTTAAAGTPRTARRLSVQEIRNTIPLVTGVDLGAALDQLPPDALDALYDRIGEAQTISAIHLEAFEAVADATAEALVREARLDDLAPACRDDVLPPWTPTTTTTLPATGFSGSPDWAMSVEEDHVYFLYSDDVTVTTTFAAPDTGTYRFTFPVTVENTRKFPEVTLSLDGVAVTTWTAGAGDQDLVVEVTIDTAASVAVQLDFAPGARGWSERGLEIWDATVEGPVDPGLGVQTADRAACAAALIPVLAERAWRRPPTPDEVTRLEGVWAAATSDGGDAAGTEADGLRMIVEAVLSSPNFLYLVEVGTPEKGRPGWYRLTDHELAARLSYTLCEGPPDEELTSLARSGDLSDAAVLEAQAVRLLDAPCGRATVARFHRQWLDLGGLDSLARDPTYYPEFTTGLGTAMRADTEYFLERMVYDEHAGVQATWSARQAWVGPETAWLYGLSAPAAHTLVDLPEDRAGPLTQPALLSATSKFSETSPVLRGVYVLERLLCQELVPPPADLDITPPELNDDMTTRERWEAHSSDPSCSGCHGAFDPIGFALEGYDAIGRTRTEENGFPVDTSGGVPLLGLTDLIGGRAVAEAVAGSTELRHCFARQWTRFGTGHLEDEDADAELIGGIESVSATSVHDALVELTRSETFRHRLVAEEMP